MSQAKKPLHVLSIGNSFSVDLQDFDVPVSEEEIKLVRETLKEFI